MANKKKVLISFDSPVTLIFVFLLVLIAIIERCFPSINWLFFCPSKIGTASGFDYKKVADYFRIFLFPFGFSNWNLLTANLVFILLLGSKVELIFGRLITSMMIIITILVAGIVCVCFGSNVIYGTNGIVFMFLILVLFTSIEKKSIPLSFILIATIYFIREIVFIIDTNSLEIFCHFLGSLAGSLIGIISYSVPQKKKSKTKA